MSLYWRAMKMWKMIKVRTLSSRRKSRQGGTMILVIVVVMKTVMKGLGKRDGSLNRGRGWGRCRSRTIILFLICPILLPWKT